MFRCLAFAVRDSIQMNEISMSESRENDRQRDVWPIAGLIAADLTRKRQRMMCIKWIRGTTKWDKCESDSKRRRKKRWKRPFPIVTPFSMHSIIALAPHCLSLFLGSFMFRFLLILLCFHFGRMKVNSMRCQGEEPHIRWAYLRFGHVSITIWLLFSWLRHASAPPILCAPSANSIVRVAVDAKIWKLWAECASAVVAATEYALKVTAKYGKWILGVDSCDSWNETKLKTVDSASAFLDILWPEIRRGMRTQKKKELNAEKVTCPLFIILARNTFIAVFFLNSFIWEFRNCVCGWLRGQHFSWLWLNN